MLREAGLTIMFSISKGLRGGMLVALSAACGGVLAADQGTQVNISATIVAPPPCVINKGKVIDVDFGDVGVNRIDGNRYMQRLDYTVECEFLDGSRQLKMKIVGSGAAFNANVLQTSVNGLGIKLLADGKALNINSAFSIDYANLPKLDAVPVKNAASTLTEGEFSSGATMLVDYF
ncbi:TPA: fimbrial protein [Serratia odorifera]|nr:fimbrial protein [Serratia odorifera]